MSDIEKIFIQTFICKRMQDRLIFELSSYKNREKAILSFAHISEELIDSNYIMHKSNKISNSDIESRLVKYCDKSKLVYVVSRNEADKKLLSLNEALQICMNDYMPSIIICNHNCAFIKEETEYGAPMKYFLNNTGIK